MVKKLISLTAILIVVGLIWISNKETVIFPELTGPKAASVIKKPKDTSISEFSQGPTSALAVLLTDKDSNWLSLVHGLESIGIPFILTEDPQEAIKHNVTLVYPVVSGKVLPREALKSLVSYVHQGGTLIAVNVLGGGLNPMFGFEQVKPSSQRFNVSFHERFKGLIAAKFERESQIQMGNPKNKKALGTNGYTSLKALPFASFEDGTGAIIGRDFVKGHAYAFGFDIGQLLFLGYSNREESIARGYVNQFEPTIDLVLRFLKSLYLRDEPDAVLLGTVPFAKELSVLITHDIDYGDSMKNSIPFAKLERDYGVPATYFIQTKYIKDYNDKIFYNRKNVLYVNQLHELGMEVGSHSVAHSRQFAHFKLGTGEEAYPDYRPFVQNLKTTNNGTILGELRVSKFLIEQSSEVSQVVSFRPGVLSNPYSIPQALEAVGYKFSSSVTANNSLTHLPFQLNWQRQAKVETNIFEFPVTIEDEEQPPLNQRLKKALEIADQISTYGGLYTILIHPNVVEGKIEFLEGFIKEWKDRAWFGTVAEFGDWWSVRGSTKISIKTTEDQVTITLQVQKPIKGLALQVPLTWKLLSNSPANLKIKQKGKTLIIDEAEGRFQVYFSR
ncbi:MAG: polysaccharide deacetylase family protein [SAR324 cluster bacterium]|nr:polysaccharide deacetylase family protein [SAR324 cluster bacterium]